MQQSAPPRLPLAPLALIGILALIWIAFSAWSVIDPAAATRLAPALATTAQIAAPLVLLIGLTIVVLITSGHRHEYVASEEAGDVASQTALSAERVAEAHALLLSQTKAYASAADQSASALLSTVESMTRRSTTLGEQTASSVATLESLAERMNAFDAALPRIESRLASLTETLGRLGDELGEHGSMLETQLQQTSVTAKDTRTQLIQASEDLAGRLATLRDGTKAVGDELSNLSELSSARIDLTLDRVKSVLDAAEQRIETQNNALTQLVERSRDSVETGSRETLERFDLHCRQIETTLDGLDQRIAQQSEKSSSWLTAASDGATALTKQFDALEQSAITRTERLGVAMTALSGETRRLSDALASGDENSDQLIKRAESLLLALDSGIRELDESVPAAIGRVEIRLAAMKQKIVEAAPSIESIESVAAAIVSRMSDSDKVVASHAATLDQALDRSRLALDAQKLQIDALADAVAQAGDGMTRLSEKVGPQMVESLVRVRETADAAANRARDAIMGIIPQSAARLAEASGEAVQKAVTSSVTSEVERLGQVADHAVKTAKGAAETLQLRLQALNDTSDALQRRLSSTAEQINAQDRELLTRRSAELIEMLNSRAIDVAKWLNQDVSQADWNAFIRGDQGIFARRAVRMVGRSEVRAIHDLYREDADFAEHVNRYVHDFETLLKGVLDAKDGSALAVIILSSDLGKLYVALAQAMERLKAN